MFHEFTGIQGQTNTTRPTDRHELVAIGLLIQTTGNITFL